MGMFHRTSPPPDPLPHLAPVSPPWEVVRGFVRDEQTTLVISKKLFTVKEVGRWAAVAETGNDDALSRPDGVVLFRMRNKKAAFLRRFICEDERGTELFRVQRKFKAFHTVLHATIPATVGDAPTLQLLDNIRGFKAEITDFHTGTVVATVSHAYWGRDFVLKNKEEYYATVAAGVDLSVVVALCLAWDRCKEDDRNSMVAGQLGGRIANNLNV